MQKTQKEIAKRSRSDKKQKKIFPNFNRKARQEKIEKNKEKALTSNNLINILKGTKNFLGVFASDELSKIRILSTPAFLISNLDISSSSGSHWLAIRIGHSTVEIFDSLGFDKTLWGKFPIGLQKLFSRFHLSHRFRFSPVLQSPDTYDCGFYCIFFILYRTSHTFSACVSVFSPLLTLNHKILINKLKSI